MATTKRYKCPYCNDKYNRHDLIDHIREKHEELIPESFTPERVVFNLINKRTCGYCRVCGCETKWNQSSMRYDVLCDKPKCKEILRIKYQENMIRVRGTDNILNDPEQQKKMLANRKISGKYKFEDGGIVGYTGSYEKKALEFMDKVLNLRSKDIISPGPTLEYEYNGKKHFYITDFYLVPYNLIIEVKDGGNNPNTKDSEGMRSSREKTIAKEKVITDSGEYNYLRLTDNDFTQLISILMELKKAYLDKLDGVIIRINEAMDGSISFEGMDTPLVEDEDMLKKNKKLLNKSLNQISDLTKDITVNESEKSFSESVDMELVTEANKVSPKTLYHLSQNNLDGKTLNPSVPNNYFTKNGYEDDTTKRVCFAPSIDKCLRALSQKCTGMELYVYVPDGKFEAFRPTHLEVPDGKITGEIWVTKPVKVKCIGKIKVIGDRGEDGLPFKYGDKTAELYDWDWEWMEKINELYIAESKSGFNELSFKNPKELSDWMKRNIGYKNYDKLMSPEDVFNAKKGSCHDQVMFEDYFFKKMGISHGKIFLIEYNEGEQEGGKTHSFIYYKDNDKFYWFENAWGGEEGIHGPYDSLNDLKDEVKEKTLKNSRYNNVEFSTVKNVETGMNLGDFVSSCLNESANMDDYRDFAVSGSDDLMDTIYDSIDFGFAERIKPKATGYGEFISDFIDIDDINRRVIEVGEKYYNNIEEEPFKYFVIFDAVDDESYEDLILEDIYGFDKCDIDVWQYNFENQGRRYSYLLVTHKSELLSVYLMPSNNINDWIEVPIDKVVMEYKVSHSGINRNLRTYSNSAFDESSSNITLYHGTDIPDFDVILPNSYNVGERFGKPRMSSYWFSNPEYAMTFATMTILDNNLPKDPNGRVCLDNDMIIILPKRYKNEALKLLKNNNGYVYYREVDTSIISRGHARYFPEYTADIPLKPDGIITIDYNEMVKRVRFVEQDYFDNIMHKYANDQMRYDTSIFQQIFDIVTKYSTGEIPKRSRVLKKYAKQSKLDECYINEASNNNCVIVSCFAGVGKNYAISELERMGFSVNNIDKLRDFYDKYKTDADYIDHINNLSKESDVLFIPYFLDMEKRYMKGRVNYYLIYPSSNCKSDYMKRFKELGFTNDQIDYLSDNWNDMIKDCKRYKNGIELSKNEYALDVIKNLIYSNIEESSFLTKEDLDYFNKYIK